MIAKNTLSDIWKIKKLGEVATFLNGRAFKPTEWETTGAQIIRIQNLNNSELNYNYTSKEFEDRYKVEKGDLLFAWSASLGVFFWTGEKAWLNQHIFKVIPNLSCNRKFLFYFLDKIISELYAKAHGSGMVHVTKGIFESTKIPLPPLSYQQELVAKIEELFSELDKGKQLLETVKQQMKTYRQAVLKWAFEGRLTDRNFSEGQLPKGWRWVKSGEIIDTINNGYTPKSEFLSQNEGEIPFIKVYNLNFNGTLNFSKNPTFIPLSIHEKELKRSICYPNDVLINIVGPPLGKVSVVPKQYDTWNINQAIVLFRPNEKILSKFISYYLQNPTTINWLEDTSKATAGQWNVKVSTCRQIPIPLPPISVQERIISEIESRLSVCDKLEEIIETSLKQAESLRQSILKQAFEGKLGTTNL